MEKDKNRRNGKIEKYNEENKTINKVKIKKKI